MAFPGQVELSEEMENFESEYAEELRIMTEESGEKSRETVELGFYFPPFSPAFSTGPPSRRSLDLCSPALAPSCRKRPLSSESPLPTMSSGMSTVDVICTLEISVLILQ